MTMLLALAIAIIGLSIFVSVSAAQHLNASPCGNPPVRVSPQFPYPILIVILCSGAALLGRLAGYLRERAAAPRVAASSPQAGGGALLVQSWVAAFLLVCALLLAFETFTLGVGIWPITFYIRCANYTQAFATIAGACLTTFLLGHWLWFPSKQEKS